MAISKYTCKWIYTYIGRIYFEINVRASKIQKYTQIHEKKLISKRKGLNVKANSIPVLVFVYSQLLRPHALNCLANVFKRY